MNEIDPDALANKLVALLSWVGRCTMSDVEAKAITDGLLNNPVDFLSSNLLWMGGDNEGPPSRDTRRFEPTDINQEPRRFNGTQTGGKTYSIDEAMNGSLEAHYLRWRKLADLNGARTDRTLLSIKSPSFDALSGRYLDRADGWGGSWPTRKPAVQLTIIASGRDIE